MIGFVCDLCRKRKPSKEIYPYSYDKKRQIVFNGSWSYCCFWCFIVLKIFEKLKLTRYKYAWCKTNKEEYDLMMKELGEWRSE